MNDSAHYEIQERFEKLFQQIVSDAIDCTEWSQTDIVFRGGQFSNSFHDVEFLMASDQNGSSFLYSSQNSGNSIYSVVGEGAKISFTRRL